MKLSLCKDRYGAELLTKTVQVMKLTIPLLLVTCLQVCAKEGYTQKVSLSEHNVSIEKVFRQIRKQTDYLFLYTREVVQSAKKVNIDTKGATIEEVLALCFKDQPLVYTIVEKTVIVKEREALKNEAPAPPIVIIGMVTDSTGKPLPGVTILVKNTKIQGITDAEGKFKLSVPSSNSILIFTSVGYLKKEIAAGTSNFLTISLSSNPKELNEVVITGFGESRSKKSLGYAVTQINGDEIRKTAQINPINALQGMVPGLQLQPGVAGAASSPKILLRGASSLNSYANMPLLVVDGMIFDNQSVTPSQGAGPDFGNILKDLNPDDVESISILKGGAVTALYGSRANNGVLMVKTKKGIAQKGLGISLSQNMMFDKAYKTTDFQNVYGAGLFATDWSTGPQGQLAINQSDYGISFGPAMTGQPFLDITGQMRKNNPNPHDLLDLYRIGQTSNTNIAISGANETSSFRFSYSRLALTNVLPNTKFDRNSLSMRATHRIGKILSLDGNVTYVHSYNLNPAQQGGNSPMYQFAYDGARNYDSKYWSTHYIDSAVGGQNNADISSIAQTIFYPIYENKAFQTENNLRAGIDVTANILPWLAFQGNANLNLFNKTYEKDQRGTDPGFGNPYYGGSVNNLLQARYRGEFVFTKNISDFSTVLHVGGETFTSGATGSSYNTNGGVLPDVYRLSNSKTAPTVADAKPNKSQLSAAYLQGSIDYRSYLYLNFYGREDWNSSLVYNDGHGKYSYLYGGVDMAWVFTQNIKHLPSFINFGKLRMSYTTTGNGTDPYTNNTGSYTAGSPYVSNTGNSVSQYSYSSNTLANQSLVPERGGKIEGGLEFRLLHNRLGGDVTVYSQDTKFQIINFGVPSTSGVNAALLNGGLVRNRGIELSIYGTPVQTKNFSWTSRLNYTHNHNTVESLPFGTSSVQLNAEDGIRTIANKGGEYGLLVASYGYGRYQATDANGKNIASPLNGQHVLSVSGNGTQSYYVRAGNYGTDPASKEPVLGSIQPKFLGSWVNTFNYKNFSLSIFLDARIGGLEYSTTEFYGSQDGNIKSSLFGRDAAHGGLAFTPTNATSQYLGFPLGTGVRNDGIALSGVYQAGSTSLGSDGATHDVSGMTFADAYKKGFVTPVNAADYYVKTYSWSRGIREAGVFTNSWVSLRQVTFGYDLPASITKKVKLNNLRVSLVGRNLVYLYNSAPDHINPENQNDTGAGNAFEEGGVPYVRSYGFSLNTVF